MHKGESQGAAPPEGVHIGVFGAVGFNDVAMD